MKRLKPKLRRKETMCGRARCTLRAHDIARSVNCNDGTFRSINMDRYQPSYNVAPGYQLPVVRRDGASDGQGAVLQCMKWGLIPSFTKQTEKPDHFRMFNARSESVGEKASFRRLLPKNRCVVVVEGFYEWKKDGSTKQPYYIHLKDGRSLVFAALYDSWKNTEGEILYTFTILTTSSASTLQWLHDRMPVILGDKGSADEWLNGTLTRYDVLLKPYENSDLVWYPVTSAMGKLSFNGPECIEEIQLKTEKKNQILKFFSKKEANDDQESEPKDTSSFSCFPRSGLPKPLKEESETDVEIRISGLQDKENKEEAVKSQVKRDYDELYIDSKPTVSEIDKLRTTPIAKKKKRLDKKAGDKQLKLTSYFKK